MLQDLLADLEPGATAARRRTGRRRGELRRRAAGAGRARVGARRCRQPADWRCATSSTTRIKYTPAGGEVRTCLRQSGEQVLIFVSDTGRGIAATEVEHVFEPFSQLDSSAARTHGGLGLGLTIARKLIERHGGHVDLRSDAAVGGSTVLVTLPASSPTPH